MRVNLIVLLALIGPSALAQDRPLPDPQAFLEHVRQRLQTDEQRQSGYVFLETRRDLKLDKSGKPARETVSVFEKYPRLPGEARWSRLVSVDGKAVPAAELDKQDRERQKKVQEYVRKLEKQTDKDREARARELEKERLENEATVEDAFRVYDIRMLGREALEEHDTILFSLTPRPGAKPRTREGKILQQLAGKAWVSESDHELVRLEVEALDTVSFGLGLLARIHEGSRMTFQRRKVNGEEWLPASASYTVSGRMMLLIPLHVGAVSEFSDYRKFTVETDTAYARPK